jgi:2-keto-4-pentenoate hydratase/2-oxohepta-3-ene-1,7-dioic acid hydratase in catechol pathway
VELGVVIGQGGADIPRERAMEHVFGYTVINDVSARDVQTGHGGQFFKGKSLDGTCPMGPWLITADEVPDPHALRLTCKVNGVTKQDGSTADMIFNIPATVAWLSQGMTLLPGDIIATGTPAGVGFARVPPEFLHPGDVVECEVQGLGVLRNPVA